MKWRKLGRVFCPDGQFPWMNSHAANPTAEVLGGNLVRVYFSTRDHSNRSSVASLVFDPRDPARILEPAVAPLLGPGPCGAFDDSGSSMGCLAARPGEIRLYYLGWNLGVTVPFRNTIGLAVSTDAGRTFAKASLAPLLDRSSIDPFCLSYPWVLRDATGWRMWYGSNLAWGATSREMNHVIKYAESADGLIWQRSGRIAIPLQQDGEYALSRPCVINDGGLFRMWFSHRGESYRIGYAESADGLAWDRRDDLSGIGISENGWDSEMIGYPCVFDCASGRYLLYSGNGYGRSGFGLAVLA